MGSSIKTVMRGSMIIVIGCLLTNVLTVEIICPDHCLCDNNTLRCSRSDVPTEIPAHISSVYITNSNFDSLKASTFNHFSWENVTFLDLHAEKGTHLPSLTFVKLENLEILGIHGDDLWTIDPSAFEGLDKIHTLDFSNNMHVRLDRLLPALNGTVRQVLPNLTNLTISRLNSVQIEALFLDSYFMRSVSFGRSLKYLDMSYTNIAVFDHNELYLLCDSITHIKAHSISLGDVRNFNDAPDCKSLRILDLTDTLLPAANVNLTFDSVLFKCIHLKDNVYNSVERFVLNGMIGGVVDINSYHLNMTECGYHMKHIFGRRNGIKWFNFTVTLPEIMRNGISEIDFSENNIEYFAPESIYQSENLQILRLSKNSLYKMQINHWKEFGRLLQESRKLQEVYIAENNLVNIPHHFFESNSNLEYIDLSRNELQSIEFTIYHLKKLKFLDLSHNLFKTIDKLTYMKINDLSANKDAPRQRQTLSIGHTTTQTSSTTAQTQTNVTFQVSLDNNPYKCSCKEETYLSIEWLQSSTAVYRHNATTYVCDFHGDYIDMLSPVIEVIRAECALQHLINILKVLIPSSVTVIVLVLVIMVICHRRHKKEQRYQEFVDHLRMGDFDKKYLVFLSFCSEDNDFVINHLYPQLQKALSEATNTDRNLVCIGDREFRLGLHVHAEVMRCMEESSVVVFVVSKTFCRKDWCQMEVGEAYDQRKPIVMLMKEFVDTDEMPKVLGRIFNRYTHASWINDDNEGHLEPDIAIISESIIELARKEHKAQN